MFGGINPKQMQGMMKKMGIAQNEIDAKRVIIELEDRNIVIDEPSVAKIKMQGQTSWQISGEEREESREGFSDEDVKIMITEADKDKDKHISEAEFMKVMMKSGLE